MIQHLRGLLADIAFSKDMTLEMAQRKAARAYWELVLLQGEPGEMKEAQRGLAKLNRRESREDE